MPECRNCGAHVTEDYVRVFSRDPEEDGVEVCPECPDKIRGKGGKPRDARSTRRTGGNADHSRSEDTTDVSKSMASPETL